ncbi:hypothetical protein ACE193_13675 [Bernardetia sp. OM2101]|uniref:capsular polysaccharide export protein, LipB/KpsS family n=1 Tax=Bernardetia sp. OM2101 TaxID=3344876 RepID=UPI0035CEB904
MNVVVFTTWVIFEFIPSIHAEIIESHLQKGHKVKVIVCDSQLPSCFYPHRDLYDKKDFSSFKSKEVCLTCQLTWRHTLTEELKIKKEDIVSLTPVPKDLVIPDFNSIKEVEDCHYKEIPIGAGIMSSLISLTRDVDIDIVKYRKELEAMYKNAVISILTMEKLTQSFNPDKVYIFNGRRAERRAVLEFCEVKDIDYDTWEIAQSLKHYYLVNRTLPHDPVRFAQDAIKLFNEPSIPKEEKIKQAEEWYQLKRYGKNEDRPNDINYKKLMNDDDISKLNIDTKKINIGVFISSEDEIASLGQKIWPFKYRQVDTINIILNHFKEDKTIHFYLRIHPNLRNITSLENDKLHQLSSPLLTVIPASSQLNSYSLMEACDKVVCFSSTIGLEATFWKKPSILFGTSSYKHIPNSIHNAETLDELFALIKHPNLPPKDKEAAMIYSYSLQNKGKLIKRLDIYDKQIVSVYSKYKLLYPIYNLYKKSSFLSKIVRKLEIEKMTKKALVFFSK